MEELDFGRRRVSWWIIDVRRNYSGVCGRWRRVVLGLHRFFIAIARAVVNHDALATSLDPMVWFVGCGVVAATPFTCHDIELWPYSVSMLVKWVAFFGHAALASGWDRSWGWGCLFCGSTHFV